jgi:hypothetical protein
MTRDRFRQLRRGERLVDRRRREWTIIAEPFQRAGRDHVVIRSGDLVRQVPELFADDYMLVAAEAEGGRLAAAESV